VDARTHRLIADHLDARRHDQARALLTRQLQRAPKDADANNLMCVVLMESGKHDQAFFYAQRTASLAPHDTGVLLNLAACQIHNGMSEKAAATFRTILSRDPREARAMSGLASSLAIQDRYAESAQAAEAGLRDHPGDALLRVALAGALLNCGRAADAVSVLREGLALDPGRLILLLRLAAALLYAPGVAPEAIFEAHRAVAQAIAPAVPRTPGSRAPTPADAGRRLRLGIVSPDLRSHPVARFLAPLLEHLDRTAFEVVCFQTHAAEDGFTARLRSLADCWRKVDELDQEALAAAIRDDRIDVLLDIVGFTTRPIPLTLLLKPAPLIVSWLAYPSSLGFPTIDYRIIDSFTDAPGAEAFHSERLIRLDPCFLCYDPPAPPGGAPPAATTYGSFNTIQKVSDDLLSLWARVLDATPGSRLVLKSIGLQEPALQEQLRARMMRQGLDPSRVELMGQTASHADHLALYGRISVALDTFPYCGTTTTCEALAMGVPVVSLRGDAHHSRVGFSLLSAIGHPELCVDNPETYVQTCATLAADPERLARLRADLPRALAASPLCDKQAFARRFGEALRHAWRDLCAAGPSAAG
jgi:predicted O-linked N-acetylglucosamine transferase (SPINDLY family)